MGILQAHMGTIGFIEFVKIHILAWTIQQVPNYRGQVSNFEILIPRVHVPNGSMQVRAMCLLKHLFCVGVDQPHIQLLFFLNSCLKWKYITLCNGI